MKQQALMYKRVGIITAIVLVLLNIILCSLLFESKSKLSYLTKEVNKTKQQLDETNKELERVKKENMRLVRIKKNSKIKTIYLTFDDGPSKYTSDVIKILNEYNVKGTFFVVNSKNNSNYQQIINNKHAIALHTYSHDYNKIYSNSDAFIKDLKEIQDKVLAATGFKATAFRFAGGSSNSYISKSDFKKVVKKTKQENLEYYDWNCDSTDASKQNVSVSQIIKSSTSCLSLTHINMLMHDGPGHENTIKALPEIIKFYKKNNYSFKTVYDDAALIQHRR